MRLEDITLILAAVAGLIGVGLLFDAWTPDEIVVKRERRRKPRIERDRSGEAWVGIGVLCLAAAFAGGDTWAYSLLAVIAGAACLVIGGWKSRGFMREAIRNRGKLRRRKAQ